MKNCPSCNRAMKAAVDRLEAVHLQMEAEAERHHDERPTTDDEHHMVTYFMTLAALYAYGLSKFPLETVVQGGASALSLAVMEHAEQPVLPAMPGVH